MRNERGITLVALIITVIVMLILTGVAVYNGLYNDGGLVNVVKNETSNQQEMVNKENEKRNTVLQDIEEQRGISINV